MSSKSQSFQAIVTDLESLLTELRTLRRIPQITSFVCDLANAVEKVRTLKTRQVARITATQLATRQLNEALEESRYEASRIRSYLRGCLGHRNEALVRFGVAPSRKRGSRTASPPNVKTEIN